MEKSSITGFDSVDPSRIAYLFDVMSENISNKQQSQPRNEVVPVREHRRSRMRGRGKVQVQDSINQIDNDTIKTGNDEIIGNKIDKNQLLSEDGEIRNQANDKCINKESGKLQHKVWKLGRLKKSMITHINKQHGEEGGQLQYKV